MNPTPVLSYTPAALTLVETQYAALKRDPQGQFLFSIAEIEELDPRVRLTVFLTALSGEGRIADYTVYRELRSEFYFALNGYIGGLTKQAYAHYATDCPLVQEAAKKHRQSFTPPKK